METRSRYRASNLPPPVIGQRWESFNQRSSTAFKSAVYSAWRLAIPPRVPGLGMLYTNISAPRDALTLSNLEKFPNTIPTEEGVNEIFLAPQACNPISGPTWGLIISYQCSIISAIEDFTILSHRNSSAPSVITDYGGIASYDVDMPGNISIALQQDNTSSMNYLSVLEMGYSQELYGDSHSSFENATFCYFNKSEGATNGYPGLEHESILEVALWQAATSENTLINPPMPDSFYNFTLGTTVSGLNGAHSTPDRFAGMLGDPALSMDAIGVQCKSSSALGIAQVDGRTSTYKSFEKSDTIITLNKQACIPRLSLAVPQVIFDSSNEDYFTPAEAEPALITSMSEDNVVAVIVRPTLLQATELRRSMLRAYATTAIQLMYDGGRGYAPAGSWKQFSFNNTNATVFEHTPVLGPTNIPPHVPAILLVFWSLGTCALSVIYGFDRRWAETLDSFSLFQFGGDASDKIKELPVVAIKDFKDHEQLIKLPGLIW